MICQSCEKLLGVTFTAIYSGALMYELRVCSCLQQTINESHETFKFLTKHYLQIMALSYGATTTDPINYYKVGPPISYFTQLYYAT